MDDMIEIICIECKHDYLSDYDIDWTYCPKCGVKNETPAVV